MRVVFDTNIYISALVIPGGAAEHAIRLAIDGAIEVGLSRPIVDEILGVLARKFARNAEELARTAIFLSSLGEYVEPTRHVRVLADIPDNRILECALAADADFIVTGDQGMLALGTWQGVEILSLRQFIDRLGHGVSEPQAAYAAALSSNELAFLSKYLKRTSRVATI